MLSCILLLTLLTLCTTSCGLRCTEPPADINMQFLPASRRAVFTCRLSHVILQERTLILLHCPSTVNSCTRSTSFHSILTAPQRNSGAVWFQLEKCCQRLEREKLGGGKWERSLSQLSLSSAWRCAVIYDTLSLSLARPTLPPLPHLFLSLFFSHTYSLSPSLVCSHVMCKAHWCDTAFNCYSKQTCKPMNWYKKAEG